MARLGLSTVTLMALSWCAPERALSDPAPPLPAPKSSLLFDLDGCDPSREFLCTRRPVGFIGAAIGVEALLAGLALEFANPPTAADDAAARRCRDVPPGEACPTQRGSHPLYGDVSPDAFFADGAAASRTFSDVALSSSLALGAGFTLLWGRRYAAAFASSVGLRCTPPSS